MRPLSIRDFSLLWTGMGVSMIGDGITLVALAWQVYELSNVPTAMSMVGVAWSLPMVVFLLLGGVVSDRFDRRRVMMASDLIRGAAIGTMGLLSVSGALRLEHVLVLIAVYGAADAFFSPAFGAIVPDIVPRGMLVEANSLEQFVRPIALQMVGPATGGLLIAAFERSGGGVGEVFLIDAASFLFSAMCVGFIHTRPARTEASSAPSPLTEIAEGFRFVRSKTWLWATLCMALVTMLFYMGPWEVLLPYIVKNHLGGGADDLGLVFAWAGAGAILASVVVAQRGLPRRHMRFMYVAFALEVSGMAAYAFAAEPWHAMAIAFVAGGCATSGMVVWGTLTQSLVPARLLGRVRSLDWLLSIGLLPVSYAITGPIAGAIGAEATLIGAGVLGGITTLAFMLVPGLYDTERDGSLHARPAVPAEPSREEALL
jgi:DHA3 family tetracycline resistance protein-like MFS transporter